MQLLSTYVSYEAHNQSRSTYRLHYDQDKAAGRFGATVTELIHNGQSAQLDNLEMLLKPLSMPHRCPVVTDFS